MATDVLLMLTSQTPVPVSCQELQRTGSGFRLTPSGSTIIPAIRFHSAFCLKINSKCFMLLLKTGFCIHPQTILNIGLHHLLCEGCPCNITCQLPEQGLLFDWRQVYQWLSILRMGTLFTHTEISHLLCCQNLLFCPQPKASTAFSSRWRSVDENDDACRSCDPSFQEVSQPSDVSVKAKDPPFVMSYQSLNHNSPDETGTFDFKVGASRRTSHSRHGNLKQPFAGLVKRRAGAGELSSPCLPTLSSVKEQRFF